MTALLAALLALSGGAWAAPRPAAPAVDLAGLQALVPVRGDQAERHLVETALRRIAGTRTGGLLLRDFLAFGTPVAVAFEDYEGSRVKTIDGRKVLEGQPGRLVHPAGAREVRLNALYTRTDPAWAREDLTRVLAHELLGHALENLRARSAGVEAFFWHYTGDETNASAVEWTVSAELGDPQEDPDEARFMKDPASFLRRKQLEMPTYAATFEVYELAHPRAELRARLERSAEERRALERRRRNLEAASAYLGHLLAWHRGQTLAGARVTPESLRFLRRQLPSALSWLDAREKLAGQVDEKLRRQLDYYGSGPGAEALAGMRACAEGEAGRRFFADADRRIAQRRQRLLSLHPRVKPLRPRPPAGQLDWKDLQRVFKADVAQDMELSSEVSSGFEDGAWAGLEAGPPPAPR